MNCLRLRLLLFPVLTMLIFGCDSGKPAESHKYSIYAMMKDGDQYLFQTDTIDSGIAYPRKQGAEVVPSRIFYDLIVRDGFYYRFDWKAHRFFKYRIVDHVFKEEKALQFSEFSSPENYKWLSKDTLLMVGYDTRSRKISYTKVHVGEMKGVEGFTDIPGPFGDFNMMSVGFVESISGKIWVGYSYLTTNNLNSYTTGDTTYLDQLSYQNMKSLKRYKDTGSVYPGGSNMRQQHSFSDERGDFYFLACPGIVWGNRPEKPTGIYRITKSDQSLDSSYFFNISSSVIKNHAYGLWYVGKGKAIIRAETKGIFSGMNDHWKVPHFNFYVLDLAAQTVKRLDLPLDKGTARQCVLVDRGKVYITINSDTEGSYVWSYNPETTFLKKGLKFDGDVDYLLRLEQLN